MENCLIVAKKKYLQIEIEVSSKNGYLQIESEIQNNQYFFLIVMICFII